MMIQPSGKVTVVVGLQRGDEGKGRVVDELAEQNDIVARFNGGPNAGHTVMLPSGKELALHVIPSGIAHTNTMNVIGNGCYIDAIKLQKEIEELSEKHVSVTPENLLISDSAHLILPSHLEEDADREAGKGAQGSTKSGIAQVARDKYLRVGLTLGEALSRESLGISKEYAEALESLRPFVGDTARYLNTSLREGKNILAEGAQGFLLDIDHGAYPYVTSSTTTSGGVATGLGVPPQSIKEVFGIMKATQSFVGGGFFVTEIHDQALLDRLRGTRGEVDAEFGTTTGRERRMGHLDLPQIRRACLINGVTQLVITKLDCVPRYGDALSVCDKYDSGGLAPSSTRELEAAIPHYKELPTWQEKISTVDQFDQLPDNARSYIEYLESALNTPITRIGVGPGRSQVIVRTKIS